jgi:hypothetical protein
MENTQEGTSRSPLAVAGLIVGVVAAAGLMGVSCAFLSSVFYFPFSAVGFGKWVSFLFAAGAVAAFGTVELRRFSNHYIRRVTGSTWLTNLITVGVPVIACVWSLTLPFDPLGLARSLNG